MSYFTKLLEMLMALHVLQKLVELPVASITLVDQPIRDVDARLQMKKWNLSSISWLWPQLLRTASLLPTLVMVATMVVLE